MTIIVKIRTSKTPFNLNNAIQNSPNNQSNDQCTTETELSDDNKKNSVCEKHRDVQLATLAGCSSIYQGQSDRL